jgi:DNA mismatch endonuclease, patch repair protein
VADTISKTRRSQNMAAIKSTNTQPEMIVRRLVFGLGYRFRLHCKDLPGKPDLVFRPRRKVIFVHGCFWHLHPAEDCLDARRPKSNTGYWGPKLSRNVERDQKHQASLRHLGWRALVIWECETRNAAKITKRVAKFLGPV